MRFEVLYISDCRNYLPVMDLLRKVLREEGVRAEIRVIRVEDAEAAKALRFMGSPTIRIDGIDIDANVGSAPIATEPSLACRWYPDGLPTAAAIRARLREAQG